MRESVLREFEERRKKGSCINSPDPKVVSSQVLVTKIPSKKEGDLSD